MVRHGAPLSSGLARLMIPGILGVAILLLWTVGATGSGPAPDPPAVDQGLIEHEQVRLILLSTAVTNSKGRPVRGLTAEDFSLFEDDTARSIDFFATEEELPIALAFVLDVSGSMEFRGRLEDSKEIIRTFVAKLRPKDRMGLICFADEQVTWVTEFTSNRLRFLRRLEVQEGLGPTALYDALAASPHLVHAETRERKAIVLLTDGLDNASRLTQLEAIWIARRVQVPIYTINFLRMKHSQLAREARQNLRVLQRFSSETGGASYAVHSPGELEDAVRRIQAELTFQYVIGYYPPKEDRDGIFRRVRVETSRKGLHVRTRRGYYVEPWTQP